MYVHLLKYIFSQFTSIQQPPFTYITSKPPTTPIFITIKRNYFGISYHSIEITYFAAHIFDATSFHSTGAQNNNAHTYALACLHT